MSAVSDVLDEINLEAVPRSYEEAVRLLAAWHDTGAADVEFYEIPDPEEKVVRLIEVGDEFPEGGVERVTPTGTWEPVVPVYSFGPSADFPFRSAIVQLRPADWRDVLTGRLPLSKPWDLDSRRRLPRPMEAAGA